MELHIFRNWDVGGQSVFHTPVQLRPALNDFLYRAAVTSYHVEQSTSSCSEIAWSCPLPLPQDARTRRYRRNQQSPIIGFNVRAGEHAYYCTEVLVPGKNSPLQQDHQDRGEAADPSADELEIQYRSVLLGIDEHQQRGHGMMLGIILVVLHEMRLSDSFSATSSYSSKDRLLDQKTHLQCPVGGRRTL